MNRRSVSLLAVNARASLSALLGTVLIVSGCGVKSLEVNVLAPMVRLDRADKRLVLLSGSVWDPKIRSTLARRGFFVARFTAPRTIERDVSPTEREQFRLAEARYGLTVYFGQQIDRCLVNENVKYSVVTYELTDIRRNEVLFTVAKGGGTGPCAWHRDDLFEELAEALQEVWEGRRRQ